MIVEGHCQCHGQEEAKEPDGVERVFVHLGDGRLVDLAHLLLHAHLDVEIEALREVGEGLPQDDLHVSVGASGGNAERPVDGGEAGDTVTGLGKRGEGRG